ncbi:MAG: hypothetical protein BWY04_00502 [candidate division CPR1 bacterium ADurb.Bin160]|uniref:Uncharacterized protein n=1 Tax=candidate division CPR1 bacterium ADurb.Bin160 TaxID=1852826 RepID=A0A1V5ZPM0_9BACT|nr:MAG: hypothetical protein BWY04_00502 [candidate division CPR1 bacterium ADurb.Bin160]
MYKNLELFEKIKNKLVLYEQEELPEDFREEDIEQTPEEEPMDMSMGIDDNKEEDPGFVGKKFELKKIYIRLITMKEYLSDSMDEELIILRNYVRDALEIFETLMSNINSFKNKIDEIIVNYYKFLVVVYGLMRDFYRRERKG